MNMLTIGAFARACRLSPKALRLYDELELLRPARVDPDTGYRYYAVEQLEQARLVAWLRRLGCRWPESARCAPSNRPPPPRDPRLLGTVEATRRTADLAGFLVDHLTAVGVVRERTPPCWNCVTPPIRPRPGPPFQPGRGLRGTRLLAVADGCGPAGALASTAAVEALRFLDTEELGRAVCSTSWRTRYREPRRRCGTSRRQRGGRHTLTALLWTGSQLALVHIGTPRVSAARNGLFPDHPRPHRGPVDDRRGPSDPEEATAHPQRAMLLKAWRRHTPLPDLRLQDASPATAPPLLRRPVHGRPRHPHRGVC